MNNSAACPTIFYIKRWTGLECRSRTPTASQVPRMHFTQPRVLLHGRLLAHIKMFLDMLVSIIIVVVVPGRGQLSRDQKMETLRKIGKRKWLLWLRPCGSYVYIQYLSIHLTMPFSNFHPKKPKLPQPVRANISTSIMYSYLMPLLNRPFLH